MKRKTMYVSDLSSEPTDVEAKCELLLRNSESKIIKAKCPHQQAIEIEDDVRNRVDLGHSLTNLVNLKAS